MIGFFVVATLLLLTALALVVYPLARARDRGPEDRRGDVIALGRERLTELKRRNEAGEISDAEYIEQVGDLEAQLADDLHSQELSDPAPERAGGRWVGVAVAVFIPVLSGVLYLALGQPQALLDDTRAPVTANPADSDHPMDVNAMVTQLAERLRQNPNDAEGWFMLGRSYMVLNRYREAADAFGKLRGLVGNVPDILVREADAIAMAQNGALAGEPARLVQTALEQDPDHAQALWMAATAAYQTGEYETALRYYRRVEPLLDGNSQQQVRGMVQELVSRGYGQAADGAAQPEPEQTASLPADVGDGTGPSLRVKVTLSPSLHESAGDRSTVFVFAKAVNGPPMPLAVVRKAVSELPLTVTLDDSQAMMPQISLSKFDRVTVGARISSSGQPTAQPGDLEGESQPVSTGTSQTVDVVIDRVVPES